MAVLQVDRRAERILLEAYRSPLGWKPEPHCADPDDFAYAARAGYMFDDVVTGHDELIGQIADLARQVSLVDASDAFLAGLSTRWLFLRPFLPSLVVARSMPQHSFEPAAGAGASAGRGPAGPCAICGLRGEPQPRIDRSVLNFERCKWGGVRHLDPGFIWFCLDRFRAEGGAKPGGDDIALFGRITSAFRASRPRTSLTTAAGLIAFLKGNVQERHAILEMLSVASILEDPAHPGFLGTFTPFRDQVLPARHFNDRGYPGAWWTGTHGINENALTTLFPQLT